MALPALGMVAMALPSIISGGISLFQSHQNEKKSEEMKKEYDKGNQQLIASFASSSGLSANAGQFLGQGQGMQQGGQFPGFM